MEGGKKLGRDTLIIMALCEECRNACKMKAPKGSTLKCPNYEPEKKRRKKNEK